MPTRSEIANEKARLKRALAAQMAKTTLSREAQADVLADLMLVLDEEDAESGSSPEVHEESNQTALTGILGATRTRNGAMTMRVGGGDIGGARGKRGRPHTSTDGAVGKTDTIYSALKTKPQLSIRELAELAYPNEGEATHKVRAILWTLKKQKRANNPEPGKWVIIG